MEQSVRGRAALAVALLVGFYVLALALAAGSIWLLWAMISMGRFRPYPAIGAVMVLYGVGRGVFFVERDGDVEGLEVTGSEHPELWQAVRQVAERMHVDPPDRIVLVPDVNAFVLQRAKLMGLVAGERIMGIGMGLLALLRVDQLHGVLAHELGHYHGGDTRLGPVLYRANESILRTVESSRGWVRHLFIGYWKLFARLTQRVRRRQELAADAQAVSVAGEQAHASALRRVAVGALAFDFLIGQYVEPVAAQGVRPRNVFDGFRSLLENPDRQTELAEAQAALESEATDVYDSHPSLAERLAFIDGAHGGDVGAEDDRPALALLTDPDAIEEQVTGEWLADATGRTDLEARDWDGLAEVYGRHAVLQAQDVTSAAGELVEEYDSGLDAVLTLLDAGRGEELASALVPEVADIASHERPEIVRGLLADAVGSAVATELVEHGGYRWETSWSGPPQLRKGRRKPLDVYGAVAVALAKERPGHTIRAWMDNATKPARSRRPAAPA